MARRHEVTHLLRRHAVPDSVAGENQEVVRISVDHDPLDVGERTDHLIGEAQSFVVFVYVVTDSPAEIETMVHSTVGCDLAAGALDTHPLLRVLGLVVDRHVDRFPVSAGDRAGVARIRDSEQITIRVKSCLTNPPRSLLLCTPYDRLHSLYRTRQSIQTPSLTPAESECSGCRRMDHSFSNFTNRAGAVSELLSSRI